MKMHKFCPLQFTHCFLY